MNAIRAHLYTNSEKDGSGRVTESSLVHALRNLRLITGRNQDTGLIDSNNTCGRSGNWIGTIGYITILDQIGDCYRPNDKTKIDNNKSAILKALSYFTDLNEEERNAIYALRNAFHHDFSLINKDKIETHKKYWAHFLVEEHETNPVVILPKEKWDGDISSRKRENATYINLRALEDLVENIYSQLLKLESSGELSLELAEGESELRARYIFYH